MKNKIWQKEINQRFFVAFAILLIFIPIFCVSAFWPIIGPYIGLSFYLILGMYALYEIFQHFHMLKKSALFFSLLLLCFFLFNVKNYEIGLLFLPFSTFKELKYILEVNISDWKIFLIFFVATFLPYLWDHKLIKNVDKFIQHILVIIIIFLISFFVQLVWIMNIKKWQWLLYFLSIAVVFDTFAYFGGWWFGKKWFHGAKLAPNLSPKKTWAGMVIGCLFTSILIACFSWFAHIFYLDYEIIKICLASIFLPIIAQMGDLFFSGIKRKYSIKDFSNLLSAHGGIMDRLDSQVFVFFFVFVLYIF